MHRVREHCISLNYQAVACSAVDLRDRGSSRGRGSRLIDVLPSRAVPTVRYGDFEWDAAKAASNRRKHGVSFEEATTVFDDPDALDAPDLHAPGRFVIIGCSAFARILFVVNAERGERIRLISARRASAAQRRKYEQGID